MKTLYSKWWFWVLAVLAFGMLLGFVLQLYTLNEIKKLGGTTAPGATAGTTPGTTTPTTTAATLATTTP